MSVSVLAAGWSGIFAGFEGPRSRWQTKETLRVFDGYFTPDVLPKFLLDGRRPIVAVGSCFARQIEMSFQRNGVVTANQLMNQHEYVLEARRNDSVLQNRFNVPSICYELKCMADPTWLGQRLLYQFKNRTYDAFFSRGQRRDIPLDDRLAMRRRIFEYQHSVLQNADAVILTLGLSEAVFDKKDELYLNSIPMLGLAATEVFEDRFDGHLIDTDTSLQALEDARLELMHVRPDIKIIVTVSPVPLDSTFSGGDVVVANAASKSMLRATAHRFSSRYDNVDYFPSFEMVTYSDPTMAFRPDRRHVTGAMVDQITGLFRSRYVAP